MSRDERRLPVLAPLAALAALTVVAIALRIWLSPRPLAIPPSTADAAILDLRETLAAAGAVAGAGFALAAVGSQARAREASVDATLAGPAWGALPALLLPIPLWAKALAAVALAWLVARLTGRGTGGLSGVLARGVAVAGLVVSLAALGLFLGPGLTPTTATAFLNASLGGQLGQAGWTRIAWGAGLVLSGAMLALARHRELVLARTGLTPPGHAVDGSVALGAAGAVLVAGVVPGLGLLATRAVRRVTGEHPLAFVPGAMLAGITVLLILDGTAQALAWPGALPVGVLAAVLASVLLAWRVVPHDPL